MLIAVDRMHMWTEREMKTTGRRRLILQCLDKINVRTYLIIKFVGVGQWDGPSQEPGTIKSNLGSSIHYYQHTPRTLWASRPYRQTHQYELLQIHLETKHRVNQTSHSGRKVSFGVLRCSSTCYPKWQPCLHLLEPPHEPFLNDLPLSLIHIWRCRRRG